MVLSCVRVQRELSCEKERWERWMAERGWSCERGGRWMAGRVGAWEQVRD